ncbi:MAG: AAA family ATPase [Candidatus Thermoplasmatota archaeon]|nr:AAA family ATPase [Candidatus Thermoplasmatota archaeon]
MVRKISFYSYKGGSGRSVSLANIAFALASKGNNVGCVELDIGAPGLYEILNLDRMPEKSCVSLLRNRDPVAVPQSVIDVGNAAHVSLKGKLYLIPALKRDVMAVEDIKWDKKTLEDFSSRVINTFAKMYELDFILFDLRSGIDLSSLIGLMLGDEYAIFTRLDKQSVEGTSWLMNTIKSKSTVNINPRHFVVVTGYRGDLARISLTKLEESIGETIEYKIPYDDKMNLQEEIVVITRQKDDPVRAAYEQLVDKEFAIE